MACGIESNQAGGHLATMRSLKRSADPRAWLPESLSVEFDLLILKCAMTD